ncbi:hypothetical protein BELL_0676g00050 [Botrytis elliptica]|uniref:Uncharacterized protein n=1 Tax=Botrytis elliptica TaxID=278938 RepID=A0A4Z1JN44_9HELO|nr:hypothetical protein BELL_0676g00050 [Botrytis elliptica]
MANVLGKSTKVVGVLVEVDCRRQRARANRGNTRERREYKMKNAGQFTYCFNERGTASSSMKFQVEEEAQGDSAK